jgi:hypothetical protein
MSAVDRGQHRAADLGRRIVARRDLERDAVGLLRAAGDLCTGRPRHHGTGDQRRMGETAAGAGSRKWKAAMVHPFTSVW